MRLRDQCKHGRWDAHGIRPAKGKRAETRCPGGREISINYEAAGETIKAMMRRPFDYALINDAVDAVVDAALGGEHR